MISTTMYMANDTINAEYKSEVSAHEDATITATTFMIKPTVPVHSED